MAKTSLLEFIHTNGNTYYIAVDPIVDKYTNAETQIRYAGGFTPNVNTTFFYIKESSAGTVTLKQGSGVFVAGKSVSGLWRVGTDFKIIET